MSSVTTDTQIENASRKAIEALYGNEIKDFRVRVVFPFATDELTAQGGLPTEEKRDSWDVQVTFLLKGVQYTVDLLIQEKDGQITYTRLIDKMEPL
ncbi:MAG: hypothetical protein ICV56_05135 [Nitrososphaeraceae archaeon]|jgi:hypothetical protein|nr:hypothetical protein [Nitrososphaeraceae archaeon]